MSEHSRPTLSLDDSAYESRTTPLVPMPDDEPRADGRAATEPRASATPGTSAEPRFSPGAEVAGRYRIETLLGRGGMGEVYRAEDIRLGQTVALKVLPASLDHDPIRLRLLIEEVRLAQRVTHPNVCRVYDLGEVAGCHFLSMELIEGEDLGAVLDRAGALPVARALHIGRQLCDGLEAIHAQNILHRDLKPSNLMVDARDRVRIADFGLASLPEDITAESALHGTPSYMAPEQIAHRKVSRQTDLYALGLVLYKLLTGRAAFPRGTASGSDGDSVQADPEQVEPISRLIDGVPPEVEAVVLACLAAEPQDRPASAAAVSAVLAGASRPALKALLALSRRREGDGTGDHGGDGDDHRLDIAGIAASLSIDALDVNMGGGDGSASAHLHAATAHLLLDRPIDAVRLALAVQMRHSVSAGDLAGAGAALGIAIDVCEYAPPVPDGREGARQPGLDLAAVATTTRLTALVGPGQILLTRSAFDLARHSPLDPDDPLDDARRVRWLAHGSYEIEGMTEPLDVFEIGLDGASPLRPPPDTDTCRRMLVQRSVAGWRPAPGLELPRRPHWITRRRISEGGFGEVWLVEHAKTAERRVFKFCHDAEKLRAFQREITLFRLLRDALGDRHDIARIYDWSFDEAPYFIESAYSPGGNLREWAEAQGGLEQVPVETRIELVSQVATALAAAHSVGVLHKDVKPANILIATDADGRPRAQLSDFGIGAVTDRDRLDDARITVLGFTETAGAGAVGAQAGTRLYMAPELLEGKPATVQADVYALGVTLYQAVVGDFSRAIGAGWERHVEDDLLREDIAAAIEGAPDQRLSSAAALAERLRDLDRRRQEREQREREHKETRLAREALYRSRRRLKVAAVAVLVMASIAGAMVYHSSRIATESRRVERERKAAEREKQVAEHEKQVAEHEKQTAQQVVALLIAIFDANDPYKTQGKDISVRDLLSRAHDKVAQLDDQPEVQARLSYTLGIVFAALDLYNEAIVLLERSLALRRKLYGGMDLVVAESLHQLAQVRDRSGRYESAEPPIREALAIRQQLSGGDSVAVAKSMHLLGKILFHKGEPGSAEEWYRASLSMRQRLLGDYDAEVAVSLRGLASVKFAKAEYQDARDIYLQALTIHENLPDVDQIEKASLLAELATCLETLGEDEKAETYLREALRIKTRIFGEAHTSVASTMGHLGYLLMMKGKTSSARQLFTQAVGIYRKVLGDENTGSHDGLVGGSWVQEYRLQ